jgi:hypothetical protein
MTKKILILAALLSTSICFAAPKVKPQLQPDNVDLIVVKPLSKMQQVVKENESANLATDDTPLAITVIESTRIDLVKAKPLSQQLGGYATLAGWVLIWDASEFILDNNVSFDGDFEAALTSFLLGTYESGSRLRATFYRGNKTVRIQEF